MTPRRTGDDKLGRNLPEAIGVCLLTTIMPQVVANLESVHVPLPEANAAGETGVGDIERDQRCLRDRHGCRRPIAQGAGPVPKEKDHAIRNEEGRQY